VYLAGQPKKEGVPLGVWAIWLPMVKNKATDEKRQLLVHSKQ